MSYLEVYQCRNVNKCYLSLWRKKQIVFLIEQMHLREFLRQIEFATLARRNVFNSFLSFAKKNLFVLSTVHFGGIGVDKKIKNDEGNETGRRRREWFVSSWFPGRSSSRLIFWAKQKKNETPDCFRQNPKWKKKEYLNLKRIICTKVSNSTNSVF